MELAPARHANRKPTPGEAAARLHNGAQMDQEAFHELYLLTPEAFKAELIGGVVHVSSPVALCHGRSHARIVHWLSLYSDETPGLDVLDNTTSILSEQSELQPDACMILSPEFGGKAIVDQYVSGPIDLVVEVANSSRDVDLGSKKLDYERAGVSEYLVVLAKEEAVRWFHRGKKGFKELAAEADGSFRSKLFPGLWLNPKGLFSGDVRPTLSFLRKGLASPEHGAFVARMKARPKKPVAPKTQRKGK